MPVGDDEGRCDQSMRPALLIRKCAKGSVARSFSFGHRLMTVAMGAATANMGATILPAIDDRSQSMPDCDGLGGADCGVKDGQHREYRHEASDRNARPSFPPCPPRPHAIL